MKRKNIKNQVKEAKIIILSYLSTRYLRILDKDTRRSNKTYPSYHRFDDGYTGVSVNYIRKYLFNNKINKDILMAILIHLLKDEKVNIIYCFNVKRFVFECRGETQHQLFNLRTFKKYFIDDIDILEVGEKYDEAIKLVKRYNILKSNLFDNNNN